MAHKTTEAQRAYARERWHIRNAAETPEAKMLRLARQRDNLARWKLKYPERYREQVRKSKRKHAEKNRAAAKLYYQSHKAQDAARLIKWRKANPEKVAAQRKRRKKDLVKHLNYESKRRALKIGVGAEDCSEKMTALRRERFCRWCCIALTAQNFTIDHIIPLSRGGAHKPDNLAAACHKCNVSKGNKLVGEWLPYMEAA